MYKGVWWADHKPKRSSSSARARRPGRLWRTRARISGHCLQDRYLLTGNAADAEEAAQDGFVKAFYALGRFRRGAELRPWLLRIVANEARNRRRSAARREPRAARRGGHPLGGRGPVPRDVCGRRRALVCAPRGGQRAAGREREVVACRYFLELSEEETAETLGLRKGTVKSRLSRGLAHLRERMEVDDV